MGECSAAGCYLAQNGNLVSFPLVTIAGLVDGINPCAIGMLLLLLGYLLVFAKKQRQVLQLGSLYIISVFFTYLLIGLVFYTFINAFQQSVWFDWVNRVIGGLLILGGLIQIKDFFRPDIGPHLRIPSVSKDSLMQLIEKGSVPGVVGLGVLVTALETPCSLPLYVGTATVLAQSGLSPIIVALYFLYYNLLFVLPLIIVLVLVWKGKAVVELSEWKHQAEKWMQLALGILMVLVGGWLFI